MEIINKDELKIRKEELKERIEKGSLFIHPTDTVYGIGCDATSEKAVNKVRQVKKRPETPFSVIAPSKKWIRENCIINEEGVKWLGKLPGPYTLILKTKKNTSLAKNIAPGLQTIGIRIPDHWISKAVSEIGDPIVTTSANIVGEDFMTSLEDLDDEIRVSTDFIVYEGEKTGRPSTIVDLTGTKAKITKR